MVYRGQTGQNSSTLDTLNRLTFVSAKYAKERPTYRTFESNTVLLLDGNREGADKSFASEDIENMGRHKQGRQDAGVTHRPKTRSQGELFPREDLCLEWKKIRRVGSGLNNLGNTCFMNSVLQCLIHTAPLAELLLSKRALAFKKADHGELDPIGMTQTLIRESLEGKRDCVSPVQHAKSLKRINRWFRLGRQEDAHEYLIALLDAMHDRSIAGMNPKPSRELEYTSFIYQIFGGKIRSQLKCTQCDYESNTYDPFLDLSLEITRAHSVQKALQRFTAGEVLDGQNSYKCPKQNKMVRAVKRMSIEDSPNILIIQLKRFEFSRSGRKISKHVDFDQTLDLSPYMSHAPKKGSALYELYGILVHQGYSMHSGHYYCFLKGTGGGEWHKFDDTRVHATSARNAMGQSPYILFYTKKSFVGKENIEETPDTNVDQVAPKETKKTKKKREEEERAAKHVTPAKNQHSPKVVDTGVEKKPMKVSRSPKMNKKHITRPLSLTPLARSKLSQGGTILLPRTRLRSTQKQTPKGSSKKKNTDIVVEDTVPSSSSSKKKKNNRSEQSMKRTDTSQEEPMSSAKRSRKRGAEALQKYKTHTVGMGLDSWDDIDTDMKKRRDRNVRKTIVPRKQLDKYDADYDKGRTKRVKTKSGKHLTSAAYDAVAKQLSKAKRFLSGK